MKVSFACIFISILSITRLDAQILVKADSVHVKEKIEDIELEKNIILSDSAKLLFTIDLYKIIIKEIINDSDSTTIRRKLSLVIEGIFLSMPDSPFGPPQFIDYMDYIRLRNIFLKQKKPATIEIIEELMNNDPILFSRYIKLELRTILISNKDLQKLPNDIYTKYLTEDAYRIYSKDFSLKNEVKCSLYISSLSKSFNTPLSKVFEEARYSIQVTILENLPDGYRLGQYPDFSLNLANFRKKDEKIFLLIVLDKVEKTINVYKELTPKRVKEKKPIVHKVVWPSETIWYKAIDPTKTVDPKKKPKK